jgi:hypothetical protein
MLDALGSALYSIVWDEKLTGEQKVAAADESIAQFHEAFMDYFPKLVALMDTRYKSAISEFEQKTAQSLAESRGAQVKDAANNLRALLTGAAPESKEPVIDHSALSSQINELKELYRCQ